MRGRGQLLAVGVIVAAACGGTAIIDPPTGNGGNDADGGSPGTGGQVATGGEGVGASGGAGGTAPSCDTPPPVGMAIGCTGAVTTGTGSFECASFACDDGGNTWTTSCTDSGCECLYNDQVICGCSGGSATCSGETCCPAPFP